MLLGVGIGSLVDGFLDLCNDPLPSDTVSPTYAP